MNNITFDRPKYELTEKVFASGSYEEALQIMARYVDIE